VDPRSLPGKNALRDAHAALDESVFAAYRFSMTKDALAQLLELNREVAHRLNTGSPVTSPGIPSNFPERGQLISSDCIAPLP
jgi:hypothetical protein